MARRSGTKHLVRTLAGGAIAVGLAVGAAGCAPLATQLQYAPSDGVRADLLEGSVRIENLLILTEQLGTPGLVLGGFSNATSEALTLTVSHRGQEITTVDVAAHASVVIDPQQTPAGDTEAPAATDPGARIWASVPAAPGATIDIDVATSAGDSATLLVPVLDGDLAPYGDLIDTYLTGTD